MNGLKANSLSFPPLFLPDTIALSDTNHVSGYLYDTIPKTGSHSDSVAKQQKEHTVIDAKIERTARDSIVQDLVHKKVYLYGDAKITYEDITIKADYIEVDFNTNSLYATGLPDSTGKVTGFPEFTEGKETFKAKTMTYNFKTKEGIIKNVLTKDDLGFLHGQKVKKMPDNSINVLRGGFTTCNLEENPHYAFKFKKARVLPDDKIVTGPVYMEIEGVPTPLVLPFGFFPNKRGRKSGILMPTYGESAKRGFFLENGGYYWAISDKVDFQITGDIYTRGSWAIKPKLRYKKRYKFGGALNFGYGVNVISTKGAPDYEKSTDFRIRWTFKQDPKARPHSTFSADVNIITSNYIKYNTTSINDFLSNEFQSSISYQTSWAGKYFLTMSGIHRQNTKTHQIDVTLPELTFAVNRFYPLKKAGGRKRFYENLSIQYTLNARNKVSTYDSLFLTEETLTQRMQNGAIHKIPISLPMKVFKYFTWSNSINITDRMYSQHIQKDWSNDTLFNGNDTVVGYVKIDTIKGFSNAFDFNITSSLTTKVYGMIKIRKGPVRAIRHVLTPIVNFSYRPDFSNEKWGYYDTYTDGNGRDITYSRYEGSIFGSPPKQKSGSVGITLNNNLEMKVRSKKDTITGLKKVKLIDNLTLMWNYNLAADSLNMSPLNLTGRTTLWKNIYLQYGAQWDPYDIDSTGKRINTYLWQSQRKLFRKENSSISLSIGLNLGDKDFKKKKKPKEATQAELDEIHQNPSEFVDWDIPWSLRLNYNFNYTNKILYNDYQRLPKRTIVQTLGFQGQINITPKWKITFKSGWDFTHKQLSLTSLNLYRDLHCWEMRFSWIPLGPRKSWNFSINIKSSVLQDLKLTRKKDFRDI